MKTPLEKHYSGNKSKRFWSRVNALNEVDLKAYGLGVRLQNLEEEVLKYIHGAERKLAEGEARS